MKLVILSVLCQIIVFCLIQQAFSRNAVNTDKKVIDDEGETISDAELGLRELGKTLNDPELLAETMQMMNDPEVAAEVCRLTMSSCGDDFIILLLCRFEE